MIPIISISHLIVLPFLIFIGFRLYVSFREKREKNVGYFFLVFLMLIIMEGILAIPGLVLKDPIKISTVFALYPFFTFLSLGFAGALPFNILKMKKTEISFLVLMFIAAISVTVINLSNVRSPETYYRPPFVYWEDTRGETMNMFIGIFSGFILLLIIFFYIFNGLKVSEKYIRVRSFLIAGGIAGFLLAAVINFVFGTSGQEYKYIYSFISTLFLILSSIVIFLGVYKRKPKETSYPQIKEEEHPKIQW